MTLFCTTPVDTPNVADLNDRLDKIDRSLRTLAMKLIAYMELETEYKILLRKYEEIVKQKQRWEKWEEKVKAQKLTAGEFAERVAMLDDEDMDKAEDDFGQDPGIAEAVEGFGNAELKIQRGASNRPRRARGIGKKYRSLERI